jgi:hypothetical protein
LPHRQAERRQSALCFLPVEFVNGRAQTDASGQVYLRGPQSAHTITVRGDLADCIIYIIEKMNLGRFSGRGIDVGAGKDEPLSDMPFPTRHILLQEPALKRIVFVRIFTDYQLADWLIFAYIEYS